jgi:hypothetical protein
VGGRRSAALWNAAAEAKALHLDLQTSLSKSANRVLAASVEGELPLVAAGGVLCVMAERDVTGARAASNGVPRRAPGVPLAADIGLRCPSGASFAGPANGISFSETVRVVMIHSSLNFYEFHDAYQRNQTNRELSCGGGASLAAFSSNGAALELGRSTINASEPLLVQLPNAIRKTANQTWYVSFRTLRLDLVVILLFFSREWFLRLTDVL